MVRYLSFFDSIHECLKKTIATSGGYGNKRVNYLDALEHARRLFLKAHSERNKVILVGNGGSAAIASHMAVDYTKNGGIRASALGNDAPSLTCYANDFGYEEVFAKQLETHSMPGDVLVVISTSGQSKNVLRTAREGTVRSLRVITLTGMKHDNMLRTMGDINFYVPSENYGVVEICHLILLHSIVSAYELGT